MVETLVQNIAQRLIVSKKTLSCVESCTAGGIAYALTHIAGSSVWFERGFVTYSNQAKIDMVNVSLQTLKEQGAVSENVAKEMALGAIKAAKSDYAVSVTGIAGPGGGTKEKPVGTVCFAWAIKDKVISETHYFTGDRAQIREQSIAHSLKGLIALL